MENSDATPPSHHCARYDADVENIVRVAKVIEDAREFSFWPLKSKDASSTNIECTSSQENPSWKLSNILLLHVKVKVNKSWYR